MAITYTHKAVPILDSDLKVIAWDITFTGTDGTTTGLIQVSPTVDCGCTLHPADQGCWTQERLSQFVAGVYEDSNVEAQLQKAIDAQAVTATRKDDFDPTTLKES